MEKIIKFNRLKDEFKNDESTQIILSVHNTLASLNGYCLNCAKNVNCDKNSELPNACGIPMLKKELKSFINKLGINLMSHYGEYRGLCVNDENDKIVVDDELRILVKPERKRGVAIGIKDKYGEEIRENDVVKTKYGRLCVVEYVRSDCFVGWDFKPVTSLEKAPDKYDLWKPENLEIVRDFEF